VTIRGSTPDGMRTTIAAEIVSWRQVIKDTNIPQQ
jgi:hypothetical protein